MSENKTYNKFSIQNGNNTQTLLDLSNDGVDEGSLLLGVTAHDNTGSPIVGSYRGGGGATNLEDGEGENSVQQKIDDADGEFYMPGSARPEISHVPTELDRIEGTDSPYETGAFGKNSAMLGRRGRVEGRGSVSVGNRNLIKSQNGFASGNANIINADNAVVGGSLNRVDGPTSMSVGYNNYVDGEQSFSTGMGNKESSNRSVMAGKANDNEGSESFVAGTGNTNKGTGSVISGYGNENEASNSIVSGLQTSNTGNKSIVSGYSNTNSGEDSIVSGSGNTNSAQKTIVVGRASSSTGEANAVFGYDSHAYGTGDFAAGWSTITGNYSGGVGYGVKVSHDNSFAVGKFNVDNSVLAFAVGMGNSDTNRLDAFEVYTDGHAEVGVQGNADKSVVIKQSLDNAVNNLNNDISDLSDEVETKLDKTGGIIDGELIITGDLTVNGTQHINNTETLAVKDNIIVTNADKDELAGLSGLAINTDATTAYGIMYDLADDAVKLGVGSIDNQGKFTFDGTNARAIVTRSDSDDITGGNLLEWDASSNSLVDSGKSVDGLSAEIGTKVSKINISDDTPRVYASINGSDTFYPLAVGYTENTIAIRYGNGRLRVGTPLDGNDAATKAYADTKLDKVTTAGSYRVYTISSAGGQGTYNCSYDADGYTIPMRSAGGVLAVGTPTESYHAANKAYVDDNTVKAPETDATQWSVLCYNGSTHKNTWYQMQEGAVGLSVPYRGSGTNNFKVGDLTPTSNGQFVANKNYVDSKTSENAIEVIGYGRY